MIVLNKDAKVHEKHFSFHGWFLNGPFLGDYMIAFNKNAKVHKEKFSFEGSFSHDPF